MEIILWGIFIITTLMFGRIILMSENSQKISKLEMFKAGKKAPFIIMIYFLDLYFLGIFYKVYFVSFLGLLFSYTFLSWLYDFYDIGYNKNKKIKLYKENYKNFYTIFGQIYLGLFEYQILVIIFMLRFINILFRINHIFYTIIFVILLFFMEKRLFKTIRQYEDYIYIRQLLRYFMFFVLGALLIFIIYLSMMINIYLFPY